MLSSFIVDVPIQAWGTAAMLAFFLAAASREEPCGLVWRRSRNPARAVVTEASRKAGFLHLHVLLVTVVECEGPLAEAQLAENRRLA
ncbi:hypothetical protein ACPCIX_16175 [Streptomyces pseudogriseolus]|uniref:hypothetical protein n=1 Tax=Streptomyces pseudogriseolus TaxID=36817 RepID=UPI003FA1E77C